MLTGIVEIVLSMLVSSFKFEPSGTLVEWRLGLTMNPFEVGAEGEANHPSMPLSVSVA